MKLFIALCAFLAVSSAFQYKSNQYQFSAINSGHRQDYQQQQSYKQVPIVRFQANQNRDGYKYSYEAANGIVAGEQGRVKSDGLSAQGHFSFVGTDGRNYGVKYQADENGFRPAGDHLPTPPPIPAEILKSLSNSGSGQYQQYYGNNNQKCTCSPY